MTAAEVFDQIGRALRSPIAGAVFSTLGVIASAARDALASDAGDDPAERLRRFRAAVRDGIFGVDAALDEVDQALAGMDAALAELKKRGPGV